MPNFTSYDQQLLESLNFQILSFQMLYLQGERHKMGLISDDEYKKILDEMYVTAASLIKKLK